MTYSEKLKDPRWQKKRLEVLGRDNFTCLYCGDKESTLHVHHKQYKGNPWEVPDSELETLCVDCHKLKHDFKEVTTMWTKALKVVKTKYDDDIVLYDIYFKNGLFEIDGCGNLNYLEDYRLREINDIYKSIGINIFELK